MESRLRYALCPVISIITSHKGVTSMNQKTTFQNKESVLNVNTAFQNAHGAIPYGMTNDYMFRAVLQTNNKALRGLVCALLHLPQEEVFSVEITNPYNFSFFCIRLFYSLMLYRVSEHQGQLLYILPKYIFLYIKPEKRL